MHSVRVSSQLLVSVLFIAVPTNTEIFKILYTLVVNAVLKPCIDAMVDKLQIITFVAVEKGMRHKEK